MTIGLHAYKFAVPDWHGIISQEEQIDIERVQKCASHIIFGEDYLSFRNALQSLKLETLVNKKDKLCIHFIKKAEKHEKHQKWFKLNDNPVNTRQSKEKYCTVQAQHTRFKKSPLNFLTNLLNDHDS